jgi:hypothetical protein
MKTLRVALLALLWLPGAALAQGKAPERASVELLLRGYDVVADAAALRGAAADLPAVLLEIEADPASSEILKLQAIDAMGRAPDPRTRARLLALIEEARGLPRAPRRAHRAVNALMESEGGRAQPLALSLLTHPDPQWALTAAAAVARFGDDAGRDAVRARAQAEKDPVIQGEFLRLVPALR